MKLIVAALSTLLASLASAQIIADSVADFSGTQGYRGWQYGYFDGPLNPSGFKQMPLYNGTYWRRGNSDWSYLDFQGGHGNGVVTSGGRQPIEVWAVRRWTASVATRVRISVHAWKWNLNCGNGIVARMFIDGVEVWNAAINYNDSVGVTYTIDRCVVPGEEIDFAIDPRSSNDLCDGSGYTAVISIPPPCPADFTCDGLVQDADFVSFVQGYNLLDCADPAMPVGCPADLNGDGFVDDADFVEFVRAYNELGCL